MIVISQKTTIHYQFVKINCLYMAWKGFFIVHCKTIPVPIFLAGSLLKSPTYGFKEGKRYISWKHHTALIFRSSAMKFRNKNPMKLDEKGRACLIIPFIASCNIVFKKVNIGFCSCRCWRESIQQDYLALNWTVTI